MISAAPNCSGLVDIPAMPCPQRPTTTYVYNDTAPTPTVTTTQLQNAAGQSKTSISTADGMGHVTLTQTAIGSGAYDNVSTVYDGEGLVYSVSNPYLTGGSQLLTLYAYDALGRVTSKTNPDQTTEKSSYLGNATTFTDENGNSWTRTYDSFGNLIGVVEPSPGTTTNYTYDALNDLTSVTQGIGTPETRSFTYDSLSRLLTATNPESGTIGYTYDANGNLFTRTDARGIKITYSYDDINRLLGKTYSDATYPVSYTYDTSSSPSPTNIIGRLTDEKTVVQGYTMTERAIDQYDVMGRIVSERQCFKGGCAGGTNYTLTHSYDLAGELVGSNNGMTGANAAAFVYGYDNAGRLNCVSTGSCTQPGTLFQATAYNAIGLTNANYATPVGGTAAFSQALTYDTRTRLTGETDTATNPTSGMPYSYAVGYDGVGNVTSMNDSIMGQWTFQTPGYDALNRLVNGAAITGPYANKYACWTYDAYGNQTMEAISSTACNNSPTPTTWAHYNTNNRITGTGLMPNGLGYDAAGDVTNDGVNMYEYDAEGRQTGVLSLTTMELTGYVYDAEGRRIEKVLVNGWNTPNPQSVIQDEYLLGLNNEQVSVLDGSGNWQWTNVYAGGKPLATYDSAGTHFTLTDWLGTKRMQLSEQISGTTATVTVGEQCTSLPFGDGLNCTGSDVNQLHFTGKERDTESGNDYFDARYYASSMGRFMSPDYNNFANDLDPVPFADLENPQSLNLYGYVLNNPLKNKDSDGHSCDPDYTTTNANGDMVVHAGQCHLDWWDLPGYAWVGLANILMSNTPKQAATGAGQMAYAYTTAVPFALAGVEMTAGAGLTSLGLEAGGKELLKDGTKAAAKQIIEDLPDGAQKASAKRAVNGATSSETVSITKSADGTITVSRTRPGFDGSQTMTKTIDSAGNSKTVQTAVDASGRQVHYDPKN